MYGYLFHRHFRPYTALFHPVRLLKFKQFDHDFLIFGKYTDFENSKIHFFGTKTLIFLTIYMTKYLNF